jgi:hypothetical protein
MKIEITSPVFKDGEMIPAKYTCDGENVSPPLEWGACPDGTMSLALICDDPDAPSGDFVHWVVYNIPADKREFPEAMPAGAVLEDGSKQGRTDFGTPGYGGPCPPPGIHRYYFKLYALDIMVDIYPGAATKQALLKAMEWHIIALGQLMGRYKRNSACKAF